MAKISKKKKMPKKVLRGRVYIQATFNNTIINITDERGNSLSWSSAGSLGFKGARKSTPHAAQLAAQSASEKAKDYGLESVDIYVAGIGSGRESAIRYFGNSPVHVSSIKDVTPMPHNGCRPKKVRRV